MQFRVAAFLVSKKQTREKKTKEKIKLSFGTIKRRQINALPLTFHRELTAIDYQLILRGREQELISKQYFICKQICRQVQSKRLF